MLFEKYISCCRFHLTKGHSVDTFYIIHTVYILTINVYITLHRVIHITLYQDVIRSDHATWR